MDFEQWFSSWEWRQHRAGLWAENNDDGDLEPLGWAVFPKKNGKFFVEAYGGGGSKVRLPFQEFDTQEQARQYCGRYEWNRQEKFAQGLRGEG